MFYIVDVSYIYIYIFFFDALNSLLNPMPKLQGQSPIIIHSRPSVLHMLHFPSPVYLQERVDLPEIGVNQPFFP